MKDLIMLLLITLLTEQIQNTFKKDHPTLQSTFWSLTRNVQRSVLLVFNFFDNHVN